MSATIKRVDSTSFYCPHSVYKREMRMKDVERSKTDLELMSEGSGDGSGVCVDIKIGR